LPDTLSRRRINMPHLAPESVEKKTAMIRLRIAADKKLSAAGGLSSGQTASKIVA